MKPLRLGSLLATAVLATVAVSTAPSPVSAATELVMSSWLPARHPIVTKVMKPWSRQVREATDGRVTVRVLSKPLGPPPAHYDMAADGVADITYGLHSFTKDDRFLRSRIGQFSFLGNNATDTSKAYWDVYANMLDAQREHKGTKLLGLFVHGPGMFHNNQRKIEEPGDFSGLRIRTPGGYIAELAGELDITTQFMGPGEVYEKLSRGVIDGVTFPSEALKAFKLTDHLKYSMIVPGGMYNTSWFLVMNQAKWEAIPAEDQAAIMKVSGTAFAELPGQTWDAADEAGTAFIAEKGIEIYGPSPAVLDAIKRIAASKEKAWADAVKASGFDGTAALAALRSKTGM